MNITETMALVQDVCGQTCKPGLARMQALLALLGDPQRGLHIVHVAGTNGKGSVAAMLASILSAAGYTVGLYTSPHLVSYRERMQVNGTWILEDALCALGHALAPCVAQMQDKPTEFERLTAMALLYFSQQRCDIVVLEAGLGGRLDATNVIDQPEVAVITNIGLEHTEILGDTLEKIAREKAGIIKSGCTVVVYPGAPEVEAVLRGTATAQGAALHVAGFAELTCVAEGLNGQRFHWRHLTDLTIGLLGRHQRYNAVLALETVCQLTRLGWHIPEAAVRQGLACARWPARLEQLGSDPIFLLDGAHNPQCAHALAESLRMLCPGKKIVFLVGVLADKAYGQTLSPICPMAQAFFCLTPESNRALPAAALAGYLIARGHTATPCTDVASGIALALSAAGEGGVVVAFGSLYLAGAVREAFRPAFRKWLRREKIRARDALTPAERVRLSRQVVEHILVTPEFQKAKTVLIYRAIRGELQLEGLEAAAQGKRFVYPRCISSTALVALTPRGADAWVAGPYGIAEPVVAQSDQVPPEEIDLVLCPCTGFDADGNRMGMGAGYYDRYLLGCTRASIALVAFEVQRVTKLPAEPWDHPVALIFTEQGCYRV